MTDTRVGDLHAFLDRHVPTTTREADSMRRIAAFLDWLPNPFDQEADPTHVTASAIVLGPSGEVALHRHKTLGMWLQPGGHIDPGEDPLTAAQRETLEETGLAALPAQDLPLHLDVHQGPRGHVHLDLRYLLRADDSVFDPGLDESQDVRWFSVEAARAQADESLAGALAAALRFRKDAKR